MTHDHLMNSRPEPATERATTGTTPRPAAARQLDVRELLGPARAVDLVHGSERYRLQLTRLNKLILTK
jgi:hemin uptake protein HemP